MKTDAQKQTDLALDIFQAQEKAIIMRWLEDPNYPDSEQQQHNICQYQEGTGMWLLNDPKFKEWKEGICHTLFCIGMPGAGKTVMSAMVVRHLTKMSRSPDVKIAVAFLYFRYDLRDTQSTQRLLRSLTRQLIGQAAGVPSSIEQASKSGDIPGVAQYQEMLQAAVDCFDRVYLVTDALDEGAEMHVKNLISGIRSLPKDKVKLLATSRAIPAIQAQFESDPVLEIRGSDLDIRNYATSRLDELSLCVRKSTELQEKIVQAIVDSTKGMFLLAKLNVDSLKDGRSINRINTILGMLPSGSGAYNDAYDRAMKRIANQSKDDHELAKKVLTWVVHAMRPLTGTDLETALAVELGKFILDPDNTIPVVELLSLCAGLVIMEEESGSIRLAHYTTQEYFSRNPQWLLSDPNRALSDVCISYLGIDAFMTGEYIDDSPFRGKHLSSHIHQYPFLSYAAAHWESHASAALSLPENDERAIQTLSLDLRLLRHPELMESYLRARGRWKHRMIPLMRGFSKSSDDFLFEKRTGLQYASGRGWFRHVLALIELGHDPNEAANDTTPLIEAVRSIHEPVVRLVEYAGDNAHGNECHCWGHNTLTEELTPCRGTSSANDWQRATHVVDPARKQACQSIAALLLESGSDPDEAPVTTLMSKTALMWAAQHGNERVVGMLYHARADINLRNCENSTALHWAAARGHKRIVEMLLEYGCNPDIADQRNKSPAWCAAAGSHWTILDLLLDTARIDVDRQAKNGTTILTLACQSSRCPQSLIKRFKNSYPCSIDRKGPRGRTPIMYAAMAKNTAVVEMLIKAGADVHLTDEYGNRVLHILAKFEDDPEDTENDIMRTLFALDVDVDVRGSGGVTALMLAAKAGHSRRVTFLLEQKPNLLLKNKDDWTSLTFAAHRGHEDVVTSLLGAGAVAQNDIAFVQAAGAGHLNILGILKEAGADLDMMTRTGRTALMCAANTGQREVARMLIETGARVNMRIAHGTSWPLILAADRGYDDIVTLLLDAGAIVNLSREEGETAQVLFWAIKCELEDLYGIEASPMGLESTEWLYESEEEELKASFKNPRSRRVEPFDWDVPFRLGRLVGMIRKACTNVNAKKLV